ncbi:PrsW family intramembrane metalloprotease [Kitasatospora sp. NPDC006697]|uniref:PrsW family intramembrane metalloprotease n=1 Tax=Kitasatospora sp. NPDC006697 TaxID=3364020 RepID=UPI0036913FDA
MTTETAAAGPDLEAARTAAIEDSGWGTPFALLQWRNACFWLLLAGLAAGAVQTVRYYRPGAAAYGTGLAIGVIAFALFTVPWVLLLRRHNRRYTGLPAKLLAVAFAWGALTATFVVALRANSAGLSLYGKLFGHGWARDWGAGLTAPFTEEPAKATALILLLGLAPRLIRSPYDGLLIGAFTGLGFQVMEDVLYTYNATVAAFGADQVPVALQMAVVRAVVGPVSHALFSGVLFAGLMWAIGRGRPGRRVTGLLLVAGAMLMHGVWDDLAALGTAALGVLGVLAVAVLAPAASLLLLWRTFRLAVPQERQWLRDILLPEAAAGLLWPIEVAAATGSRKERRAYLRAWQGRAGRKKGKRLLRATRRLARELAFARGGAEEAVTRARQEITGLRAPA